MSGRGESSEGRVISCRGWGAVAGRGESSAAGVGAVAGRGVIRLQWWGAVAGRGESSAAGVGAVARQGRHQTAVVGGLWPAGASHQLQGGGGCGRQGASSDCSGGGLWPAGASSDCRGGGLWPAGASHQLQGWGAVAGRGVIRLQEKSSGLAHVLLDDAVLNGVIRSHAPFGYGHGTAQRRQGVG